MDQADTIITLGERLDVSTVDSRWKQIESLLEQNTTGRIIADASHVRICDSSGLRLLIHLQRKAAIARRRLVVYKPDESLMTILANTRLTHIFTIMSTLEPDAAVYREP